MWNVTKALGVAGALAAGLVLWATPASAQTSNTLYACVSVGHDYDNHDNGYYLYNRNDPQIRLAVMPLA